MSLNALKLAYLKATSPSLEGIELEAAVAGVTVADLVQFALSPAQSLTFTSAEVDSFIASEWPDAADRLQCSIVRMGQHPTLCLSNLDECNFDATYVLDSDTTMEEVKGFLRTSATESLRDWFE